MKPSYAFLALSLATAAGCTPRDSVESASVTLLNRPALPVTVDDTSITIPVGVSAYLAFDVAGKNGEYTGAYDVTPADPQVVGVAPDTATDVPNDAESCVEPSEDGVVTRYLVFGSTVGKTTLQVRPTRNCANDGDDGDVTISVTVVEQSP
jgi:hypothetical protein